MNNTIGIDVSKDTLDVHRLADGQHKQFFNSKTGHAHLIKWIEVQPDPLAIFEGQTMGLAGRIIGYWSESAGFGNSRTRISVIPG